MISLVVGRPPDWMLEPSQILAFSLSWCVRPHDLPLCRLSVIISAAHSGG